MLNSIDITTFASAWRFASTGGLVGHLPLILLIAQVLQKFQIIVIHLLLL